MSTLPNPPVAETTQRWSDSKASDKYKESEASRSSLYVDVFQNIHDIVMEQERYLFSSEELTYFQRLNAMSYPARYLLIRLCLRKRGKWHSLSNLEQRYKIEIGGKERISKIIDELCGTTHNTVKTDDEEPNIIDLTQDEDMETSLASKTLDLSDYMKANESATRSTSHQNIPGQVHVFAEDDANASLPELLDCLTHDELKDIGKQMKVTRTGQTRSHLSEAIISHASNQTTLAFPALTLCNEAANRKQKQPASTLAKDSRLNQATVVRRLVTKSLIRCIRISNTILSLFDRLNIVYFRSTSHSGSPLALPALLTAFRKRCHADTSYVRTAGVFLSRQALIDYEEALALEAHIDEALSGQTQVVPSPPSSSYKSAQGRVKGKGKGKAAEKEPLFSISPRIEGAKVVREIWTEIYDRWKMLVNVTDTQGRSPALERFDCGHVLTRITYKGAQALAILKEYDLEMEILRALLAQAKWRRGSRGAWYDRLALVLMTHKEKTQETLEMAMDVVMNGLRDSLTHLTYRPRLERRLTRLEKMLNIPMSERHKCDGQLKKARDVYVEGVRFKNKSKPSFWNRFDKGTNAPLSSTQSHITEANEDIMQNSRPWKGKTLWITKDGEEVSVEQFALEYYSELGFKGFHSEGRIVSTIFGLLFWDVIFASVPGAFETPYQSAPLDIFEDTFYIARQELIDQRLAALERGEARVLLEQVIAREWEHRTSCIGVDWDFQSDDLLDIVDCLGGHALSIICQMICEDYGQWRGGVPDLLVWNIATRECRFVEVKSPNDRLQENQRVWIDVLISSETLVDLCHVVEKGERRKGVRASRAFSRMTDRGTTSDPESESETGPGEDDTDQLRDQNLTKKHDRDPEDMTHVIVKKRRVHVPDVTSRRTRKSSRL